MVGLKTYPLLMKNTLNLVGNVKIDERLMVK